MLIERIEHKWLAAFVRTFTLCKVAPGEVVAILSETQSRRVNVDMARLALESLGARVFEITLTSPPLTAPAPVRSTGASDAIGQLAPVVASLARADFVVDCTVEGLLHAPELPAILQGVQDGSGKRPRVLMVTARDGLADRRAREPDGGRRHLLPAGRLAGGRARVAERHRAGSAAAAGCRSCCRCRRRGKSSRARDECPCGPRNRYAA